MNKHLHRIIFNSTRGMRMVVQETASSAGKATGATAGSGSVGVGNARQGFVGFDAIALAVLCLVSAPLQLMSEAQAQVVADPTAPRNQQPTVLSTANGLPLVNIQTPSAAGVSRNTYSQFDVTHSGAILNNARTNVQTQLGGWTQGNPWLAAGSARVILNEVNSSSASQLRGFVEVAGQRAEVIIANPAGVNIDGAGFINASRATVTTGTALVSGGNLDGFVVQRGLVTINGAGLDARQTDYTSILARAVEVNGAVLANELQVVTGANQVGAGQASVTPVSGTGAAPAFALDTSALGGMYAGKITLMGTEAGVGVRNSGVVGASAGDVVVLANGWLVNSGSMQAAGSVQINASGAVTNSGTVYASGNTTVAATGSITNRGLIAAQGNTSVNVSGTGGSFNSSAGSVLAAGLNSDGSVQSSGDLGVATSGAISLNGQMTAAGKVSVSASQIDLTGGSAQAQSLTITATSGDVDATRSTVIVTDTLTINAASTVHTSDARISARQLNLAAKNLSNAGGQIIQTGMGNTSVSLSGNLDNSRGRIATNSQDLSISAQTLANSGGRIEHAGTGTLAIAVDSGVDNTDGLIASVNNLSLSAASLDNTRGSVKAETGNTGLTVAALNNTAGSVFAGGNLRTSATTVANSGSLYAAGNQTLEAGGSVTNSGVIAAQGSTTIIANSLNSSASSLMGAGIKAGGSLTAAANLNIVTTQALEAKGQNLASGDISWSGASVALTESRTGAANIALTATTGDVSTRGATVATTGMLHVTARSQTTQSLLNNQGSISAGQLSLDVANLDNTQGLLVQTGTGNAVIALSSPTGRLDNTQGRVAVNSENLTLAAPTVSNVDGKIEHAGNGTLILSATTFSGQRGQITSNGALDLSAGTVIHDGASTVARQVSIAATSLSNRAGAIVQTGNATGRISVAGAIDNTAGSITSNGSTTVNASTLTNAQGKITAVQNADVTASMRLDNIDGLIAAGQRLSVAGGMINNQNAGSLEGDTLSVNATQAITNSGKLIAGRQLDVTAAGTLDNSGQITGQQTTVQAAVIDNRASGRIEGNTLTVVADTVNNSGGIVGERVTVSAGILNNQGGTALVAGTGSVDLYVRNTLNNTGGANVYSLGDLNIASDSTRDASGTLLNRTALVNNDTSLLQADGNMQIAAQTLVNTRVAPLITSSTTSSTQTLGKRSAYWMCEYGNYIDSFAGYCAAGYASLSWYDPAIHINPLSEKPGMFIGGWRVETERLTTTTVTDEQLQGPLQPEPKILVGSNLVLRNVGSLRNEYGAILAGGDATIGNADPSGSYQTASVNNLGGVINRSTLVDEYSVFRWNRNYGAANSVSLPPVATTTVVDRVGGTMSAGGSFSIYAGSVVNSNALPGQSNVSGAATPGPAGSAFILPSLSALVAATGGVGTITAGAPPGTAGALALPGQSIRPVQPGRGISSLGALTLPLPKNPGQNYLVESDPRFTSYKNWVSSEYLLKQLNYDPATLQKRLGDGFFEQKLIREQVAQLTGRRFLGDYRSDDEQYQALMTSSASVAQQWGLRPGLALSAAQIAQLTSDLVWLVEQDVVFTDGTSTKALVPVVYLSQVHTADLRPTGALIAGQSLRIQAQGDITNSGALQAQRSILLAANTVSNQLGRIDAVQGSTRILADTDILNRSGLISGSGVQLTAGRDIRIDALTRPFTSTTRTVAGQVSGSNTEVGPQGAIVSRGELSMGAGRDVLLAGAVLSATGNARVSAGNNLLIDTVQTRQSTLDTGLNGVRQTQGTTGIASTVQTGGNLSLIAGADTTLKAARLSAGKDLSVVSGGNLTIGAAVDTVQLDENLRAKGYVRQDQRYEERVAGSVLTANGNVTLAALQAAPGSAASPAGTGTSTGAADPAGGNLTVEGSSVSAAGTLAVVATGNVSVVEARQKSAFDLFNETRGSQAFSSKTQTERDTGASDRAVASTLGGQQVRIASGNDLTVRGSSVASSQGTSLLAGNNLIVEAAQNTSSSSTFREEKKSGLMISGSLANPNSLGVDFKRQQSQTATTASTTQAGSSITSASGATSVVARNGVLAVIGSDVSAGADRQLTLRGEQVYLGGALNSRESSSEQTRSATNIHAGIVKPSVGIFARAGVKGSGSSTSLVATTLSGGNISITATGTPGLNADGSANPTTPSGISLAGVRITTAGTLSLDADKGDLAFNIVQTTTGSSRETSQRDLAYQKAQGAGASSTEAQYNDLTVGKLTIQANTVTVQQAQSAGTAGAATPVPIRELASKPGMGWVSEVERQSAELARTNPAAALRIQNVKLAHDQWDYKQQGLTKEGAAIVTVVVAYFTAGAASGAGTALAGTVGATGTTAAVVAGATTAALTTLATQASVSLINNQGDLGATLKDLGSKESVKALVTAMVTGGVLQGMNFSPTGQPSVAGGAQTFTSQLGQNLQAGVARTLVSTAISGGSLEDGLKTAITSAFIDTAAAQGANWIGGNTEGLTNTLAHALAGCAAGAARAGQDGCTAGAVGASIGELAAEAYGRRPDTVEFAAMISGIGAALAGGDAAQITLASSAGANAAANNYLSHTQATMRAVLENRQRSGQALSPAEQQQLDSLNVLDIAKDLAIKDACKTAGDTCNAARRDLNASIASYSTPAATGNNAQLSPTGNASVMSERNQNLQLVNDPKLASQTLNDSFLEFAVPQLAGYAVGGALGLYMQEARAIYGAIKTDASLVGANGGTAAVTKIDLAPPPNSYPVYTRGAGAAEGPLPPGYTTVSRWVSPEEASLWVQNQGTAIPAAVPRNGTPQVYVSEAGAPRAPGATGTVRIDFAVPNSMLQTGNASNNSMILQPSSSTPIYNVNIHVPNGVTLPTAR